MAETAGKFALDTRWAVPSADLCCLFPCRGCPDSRRTACWVCRQVCYTHDERELIRGLLHLHAAEAHSCFCCAEGGAKGCARTSCYEGSESSERVSRLTNILQLVDKTGGPSGISWPLLLQSGQHRCRQGKEARSVECLRQHVFGQRRQQCRATAPMSGCRCMCRTNVACLATLPCWTVELASIGARTCTVSLSSPETRSLPRSDLST